MILQVYTETPLFLITPFQSFYPTLKLQSIDPPSSGEGCQREVFQHLRKRCRKYLGFAFWKKTLGFEGTYCWWNKSCTTKDDDYPIIHKVLYIPGGAGFLPSTVVSGWTKPGWKICMIVKMGKKSSPKVRGENHTNLLELPPKHLGTSKKPTDRDWEDNMWLNLPASYNHYLDLLACDPCRDFKKRWPKKIIYIPTGGVSYSWWWGIPWYQSIIRNNNPPRSPNPRYQLKHNERKSSPPPQRASRWSLARMIIPTEWTPWVYYSENRQDEMKDDFSRKV